MRRTMLIGVMVLALVLVYAAGDAMACGMKDKSRVSKLLGTIVKSPQGEDVAVITDFMKDRTSGAAFFILAYGGEDEYAQGGRLVAVPAMILSCGEQDCVLNVGKERLDSAPVFTSEEDFRNQRMADDIYRYFGLQPDWTEDEPMKPQMAPEFRGEYEGL
jgi:hypothetical protein